MVSEVLFGCFPLHRFFFVFSNLLLLLDLEKNCINKSIISNFLAII